MGGGRGGREQRQGSVYSALPYRERKGEKAVGGKERAMLNTRNRTRQAQQCAYLLTPRACPPDALGAMWILRDAPGDASRSSLIWRRAALGRGET